MVDLKDYNVKAADWRAQLKLNTRRTRQVIFIYVAIYVFIGLIVDVLLAAGLYPQATLTQLFGGLLTLQIFPYATITMLIVAGISLLITYAAHNKIMLLGTEYVEVTPESASSLEEKQFYNVIEEMKVAAGLNYMPRVYIIEAAYMNAFASGMSEKSAMVAITRGLLEKLDRAELQAVMAHELSHIRHQDIKLTLTVAVLSNIMLIVVDLLFYNMIFSRRRDDRDNRIFLIIIILRYVLPLITVFLTLFLSRTREYMADAGCVELMRDNGPLARALLKIEQDGQANREAYREAYGKTAHEDLRRAAYLYDPVSTGIEPIKAVSSIFSTHPTLSDRLKALGYNRRSDEQ
jgi:heat shock protein HtpX